jgi:hypothetical protein
MVKILNFDRPRFFGATGEGSPSRHPESVSIVEGMSLNLIYKTVSMTVKVTKVVAPQLEFEGSIEYFNRNDIEFDGLHHGDLIRFLHGDIEHIH